MSLNATNLFIQASPLPATFQGTPNDFFTEMIKRMRILSPSGTNFIFIGDTAPTSNVGPWLKNGTQWWVWDPATKQYAPQDISASFTPAFTMGHSQPTTTTPPVWLQTTLDAMSANPNFFGEMIRWYVFDGVNWLSPHPVPPNSPECRIWLGSEPALWSYDGGDGTNPATNPPTANTGAMWVVEHAFDFRFPLGAGTNIAAFDGNVASAAAVLEQGGDERVALTGDQLGSHTHPLAAPDDTTTPLDATSQLSVKGSRTGEEYALVDSALPATLGISGPSDGNKTHQNMPPYLGVFFIKRSTRYYYTPA
jgi:hypothetical protein